MAPAIFQKLNYKQQSPIYVLDAPPSFEAAVSSMRKAADVRTGLAGARGVQFALAFATRKSEVDAFARAVARAAEGDAVIWVAYPKGSSKNYKCEFNRDTGWECFGAGGFEPVRQVAIDADWSALRFRRVEHIRTMTRSFAMTKAGREKAAQGRPARTRTGQVTPP